MTSLLHLVHCRLHNLAHVELNAIDLAWDTVARFSGLQMDQVCEYIRSYWCAS